MHEDIRVLLNAYMDGELHGPRLQQMELHLASCEACRKELRELNLVSDLLQAAPAPEFTSAERFASTLSLSLPRQNPPQRTAVLAWWLIPAGLLAAWFFVQTVFALTGMVTAMETTGLLGRSVAGLGVGQQTIWFTAVTDLIGGQWGGAQSTLSLLNELNVFGVNILRSFLWQALIVLLYWGWLVAWRFHRNPQSLKSVSA